MKAFVTSIGEPTTDLCVWSLERQGFDVSVIQDKTSLAHKLKVIYNQADEDFIRVDADVICNRNVTKLEAPYGVWWLQGLTFDWWKMDITPGGVQLITKRALPYLREAITVIKDQDRPETEMYRLPEFHNPRRCLTSDLVCGLNGWGQNDIQRVKKVKAGRGQEYDFQIAEKLNVTC